MNPGTSLPLRLKSTTSSTPPSKIELDANEKEMDMDDLDARLLEAHRSGDLDLITKLQAEFRGSRDTYRGGPPPQIVDRRTNRSSAPTPKEFRARADARRSPVLVRRVVLTPSARDSITNFYRGDGIEETGGALIGLIAGPTVFVNFATEWVHAERTRTSLRHFPEEITDIEELYQQPVCGDWHLHPGESDVQPSGQDRSAWGKHAGDIGHPWASIIVGDNGGVYRPIKAYISHFHGGNTNTVPVPLIDEK